MIYSLRELVTRDFVEFSRSGQINKLWYIATQCIISISVTAINFLLLTIAFAHFSVMQIIRDVLFTVLLF